MPETSTDAIELLTYKQAAGKLKVSERTLRRWVDSNKISFVELPSSDDYRVIRFRHEDIRLLVEKGYRPAKAVGTCSGVVKLQFSEDELVNPITFD